MRPIEKTTITGSNTPRPSVRANQADVIEFGRPSKKVATLTSKNSDSNFDPANVRDEFYSLYMTD